jgi:hypothetical protein
MVAGAVALAGILSVMLAPKAVHAIVSTLVTVVNTSANPVPVTEGKDLVQEPFATSICTTGDGPPGYCSGTATALGVATPPGSFTVPATDSEGNPVKALVIQFVSGLCNATDLALKTTVPANQVNGITTAANFIGTGGSSGIVDQTTSIVTSPGSSVSIYTTSSNGCWLTVNGYLAH